MNINRLEHTYCAPSREPNCRARIGFILANSNATFQSDMLAVRPWGVDCTFSYKGDHHLKNAGAHNFEQELAKISKASAAIQLNGDLDVASYVGGCVSAAVGVPRVLEAVRAGSPDALVSSMYTATKRATRALAAKRVTIATSYDHEVNHFIRSVFESFGTVVLNIQSFEQNYCAEPLSVPPAKIRDFALSLDRADADAIVVCSTTLRAMEAIEEIENTAGKAAICANQISIWDALRSAGISDKIDGYGSLLRDH